MSYLNRKSKLMSELQSTYCALGLVGQIQDPETETMICTMCKTPIPDDELLYGKHPARTVSGEPMCLDCQQDIEALHAKAKSKNGSEIL